MKILIASDIHGDINSAKFIISAFEKEKCDKLLLLGDLLYHGPRNNLPQGYDPTEVISLLNNNKENILAVRGNCDTEVDQMVLDFPIMAEYCYLSIDGLSILATHGHKINKTDSSLFRKGEILLHGHTHIPACEIFGDSNCYLNPGSTTLPKGGFPKSYMIYEDRSFTVKDFNGNVIFTKRI